MVSYSFHGSPLPVCHAQQVLMEGLNSLDSDFDRLGEAFDDRVRSSWLLEDRRVRGWRLDKRMPGPGRREESELEKLFLQQDKFVQEKSCLAGEANWKRMIAGQPLRFIKVICFR